MLRKKGKRICNNHIPQMCTSFYNKDCDSELVYYGECTQSEPITLKLMWKSNFHTSVINKVILIRPK